MLTSAAPTTSSVAGSRGTGGAAVEVVEVTQITQERPTLHDVSFSVAPGEVVAIVWGSGTGETTLLETLVGIRPPATGAVRISGSKSGSEVGYVPQDDIVHRDLPLARALGYAAQLRLPAGTATDAVDRIVDETLASLGLAERRNVRFGSLSGRAQPVGASLAIPLGGR
jgi:ABC transport system ATP-binding/permease protein